jgi:hypothetical protein
MPNTLTAPQVSFTLTVDPLSVPLMSQVLWNELRLSLSCFLGLPAIRFDHNMYVVNITTTSAGTGGASGSKTTTGMAPSDSINTGDLTDCSSVSNQNTLRLLKNALPHPRSESRRLSNAAVQLRMTVLLQVSSAATGAALKATIDSMQASTHTQLRHCVVCA